MCGPPAQMGDSEVRGCAQIHTHTHTHTHAHTHTHTHTHTHAHTPCTSVFHLQYVYSHVYESNMVDPPLIPLPLPSSPPRFCDTNTTVNLKCLEFLSSLFALLIKEKYRMSDFEATAFLPFLVIKVRMHTGE